MNTLNLSKTCIPTLWSIQFADRIIALAALLLFFPLISCIYLYLKVMNKTKLERVYIHGTDNLVGLYQFPYQGWTHQLPVIINIIKGDIGLLGDEVHFSFEPKPVLFCRPGLVSISSMQRRIGIDFEDSLPSLRKAYSSLWNYLLALVRVTINSALTSNKTSQAERISLFGLSLHNATMNGMLNLIVSKAKTPAKSLTQFAFVNADCLNKAYTDSQYHRELNNCEAIFADGIGARIACRWLGVGLKANLNGTDMLPLLCEQLIKEELSLFLLGGAPEVAHQAAQQLQLSHPMLKIAGTHHGFFHEADTKSVLKIINSSGAAVLLVAMGAPKQELWLAKYHSKLSPAVGIGVGGLFDFYSNRINRAPLWLRQMGMEWIWRLIQEPRRMWRRYIFGNPLFLLRVRKEVRQLNNQKPHQSETKTNVINYPNLSKSSTQQRCGRIQLRLLLNRIAKRSLDVSVAAFALVLLAPLLLLVALFIRLESPGAVLFSQQRVGKFNHTFTMWKFRSMYQDAEARLASLQKANEMQGGVIFKMKCDPRITRIGKFIRKTSIDELPQLWNVILGDMSLVGPRPALPREVAQYSPSDRRRLQVKPGITCIWQVSGRSNIPFDRQVELDVDYIYQQSLTEDIYLLIKTIPAVIFSRGAY
ncbi:glycosyl transferase [Shewanella baltica]|nr:MULTISPECIES: WecB/TagA/CpsF family glycosyltransferase [Shewanella]AEG09455.1 exopolysaccharide biosynthesis polyprenyl glycosylphosphotransferase [Shewanella baltica BA175]KZK70138.1 glycosyl transferase [Shewanella baltica]MDT3322268.1 WecB/TagA/CpsF family glycosyltransferase [Shewanella sp. SP1S2-4]